MSSFTYNRRWDEEPRYAVRCDGCGKALFTDRTGFEFPAHITEDARRAGWAHPKEGQKWRDYCPDCEAYRRMIARKTHFGE